MTRLDLVRVTTERHTSDQRAAATAAESALARIAPAQPRHGPLGWNRHVVESRTPDPPLLVRCPGGQVWLYVYGDHGYRCVHVHHHY